MESRNVTGQTPVDARAAGIGRAAVIGAILGYLAVFIIVSAIAFIAGAGLSALGVAAFAALWGGLGWGGMVGAVVYADRMGDDEPSARPPPS